VNITGGLEARPSGLPSAGVALWSVPEEVSVTAAKSTLPGADARSEAPAGGDAIEPTEQAIFVASHESLFVDAPASLCDACGRSLGDAEPTEGYGVPGHGVYLWTRGDETRVENVPLCASCASAIGMTALARWEIEEEEG
jgi:hypothetical protein